MEAAARSIRRRGPDYRRCENRASGIVARLIAFDPEREARGWILRRWCERSPRSCRRQGGDACRAPSQRAVTSTPSRAGQLAMKLVASHLKNSGRTTPHSGLSRFQMLKDTQSARQHSLVAQDSLEQLFGVVVAAALASRVPAGPAASGFVQAAASRARHPHCRPHQGGQSA